MNYQRLFEYFLNEHDVILLETDMQEIIRIVNEIKEQEDELYEDELGRSIFGINE